MANFTRRNAWNNGGTFENPDLLWYAKGVGVMQLRSLADPNSWWFFAAIHGQYITSPGILGFPAWGFIPAPPQVPTTPLPAQHLQDLYWDQCQHQSWYFPPWHRGYLLALEAQIRAAVVSLGGPADWALPYWNYFGPDAQSGIPPAFTEQTLPDGTLNPLFVSARHGPNGDGVIFVSTEANEGCQENTVYTGVNAVTPSPGYGGPETEFWHGGGNRSGGNLEQNPHNQVHGDIGGIEVQRLFRVGLAFVGELDAALLPGGLRDTFQANGHSLSSEARVQILQEGALWQIIDVGQDFFVFNNTTLMMLEIIDLNRGLMGDPGTAALDPIFYLHHSNIDRMWAVWNAKGNSNPGDQNWLAGPTAVGERKFTMPMPGGSPWEFTPAHVNSLSQLDYIYDDMPMTVVPPPPILAQRLMKLGVAPAAARAAQGGNMGSRGDVELLGANDGALPIRSSGARATVRLDEEVRGRVFASLAAASEANLPDRVYLRLENVRGTIDAYKLKVSVNQQSVGTVALFGLNRASLADGQHSGAGLTFEFDVTEIIDKLFLVNAIDVNSLDVRIEPNHAFADVAQITIGRVSVYRQGL
ncbi:MAG: tyrosinase family protein [Caldilineaceae bacterium]